MRFAEGNVLRPAAVALLTTMAMTMAAAETATINVPPDHLLMLDGRGHPVKLATKELHQWLLPSSDMGLNAHVADELKAAARALHYQNPDFQKLKMDLGASAPGVSSSSHGTAK